MTLELARARPITPGQADTGKRPDDRQNTHAVDHSTIAGVGNLVPPLRGASPLIASISIHKPRENHRRPSPRHQGDTLSEGPKPRFYPLPRAAALPASTTQGLEGPEHASSEDGRGQPHSQPCHRTRALRRRPKNRRTGEGAGNERWDGSRASRIDGEAGRSSARSVVETQAESHGEAITAPDTRPGSPGDARRGGRQLREAARGWRRRTDPAIGRS